jgi:transcriptional regulator with XRE-family HTH domain
MQPNTHFRELRKKLKLSQVELARQIDVSQGTITDIERGRIGVSKKVAKRLQEKFGLELKEINGDVESINTENIQEKSSQKKLANFEEALESLRVFHEQFLNDLPGNQNWNIANTITFELMRAHHDQMEQFNEVLLQYTELSNKLFGFFTQYHQLYTSVLQTEIYQELNSGTTEFQIRAALNKRISNLKSLRETCSQLSETLKVSLENFRALSLQNETAYI